MWNSDLRFRLVWVIIGLVCSAMLLLSGAAYARREPAKPPSAGRVSLPPVIRGIYLPAAVVEADGSLTAPLVRNLQDASANLVVVEGLTTITAVKGAQLWRGIALGSYSKVGAQVPARGVLLNTLWRDSATSASEPADGDILSSITSALQHSGQVPFTGIALAAGQWNDLASSSGVPQAQAIQLICPDLLSFSTESDEPTSHTVADQLRSLVKPGNTARVAPWIDLEAASSPEDLEAAIRQCIQETGGVVVQVSPPGISQDQWDAIRRGFEANYLLPEG